MSSSLDKSHPEGLYVREWRPASPRGAFILLHGMESHSGWFGETASRLVGDGWAVIAYDRYGWGKSRGARGHLVSYREVVEDTAALACAAREKYGPVHLAGMSWGGMAALYLGLRRGWLFDSLALLAPGLAAKRDFGIVDTFRVAAALLAKDSTRLVSPRFEPRNFTRNPRWQQFISHDHDRVRQVSASFCFETLKMRRFIRQTAGRRQLPPTLCLLAGDDDIIDNRVAGDVCRRAGARVESLEGAAHTLIFERPEETVARLTAHAAGAGSARAEKPRRFWVIGAGAVGGMTASLLTFGGHRGGVLVKPHHVEQLGGKGILLRSGGAWRRTGGELAIAASPSELPADPDLVVLAVKSFDTKTALSQLAGAISPRTVIVSLQNGVDNEEAIAAAFPHNTIVAASICASLELARPGEVVWADDRGGLGAALHRGDPVAAHAAWQDIMPATGMECRWFAGDNAGNRLKWSKLMLNIGFNALNSVTGLSSAELLRDRGHGALAIRALREGFAAMDRLSLKPVDLPGFPVAKLRLLVKAPLEWARRIMAWQAGRAPEAAFSMRQDVLKKRQHTEINELNRKIVEVGRRFGLRVEANEKLTKLLENFNNIH